MKHRACAAANITPHNINTHLPKHIPIETYDAIISHVVRHLRQRKGYTSNIPKGLTKLSDTAYPKMKLIIYIHQKTIISNTITINILFFYYNSKSSPIVFSYSSINSDSVTFSLIQSMTDFTLAFAFFMLVICTSFLYDIFGKRCFNLKQ